MPNSALLFILLSAVMHAGWNLILKTTGHKLAFNVFMHAAAIAIFSAYWLVRHGAIPLPRGPVLPFAFAAGFFFSIYHACLTASYERADVSLAYPLTTTGPLYIPLWAYLFLNERLSLLGMGGILVVFLGAYILQMREFSWDGIFFPLWNIRLPGVLFALSAGLFYSVGAIVDKQGVTVADVFVYTYYLDIALFLFLLAYALMTPVVYHLPDRPSDGEGVVRNLGPPGERHRRGGGRDPSLPGTVRADPPAGRGAHRPRGHLHPPGVAT
jgi:drug/metabolite transporter (DMT)-like permease